MSKVYDKAQLTLRSPTFKDSGGNAANPGTVTFNYVIGREGRLNMPEPEPDGSDGVYKVQFIPEHPGWLYGQWKGTGGGVPDQTFPVRMPVHSSAGARS